MYAYSSDTTISGVAVLVSLPIVTTFSHVVIGVQYGTVINHVLTVPYSVLFDSIFTSYSVLSQTAYKLTLYQPVLDNPLTTCPLV